MDRSWMYSNRMSDEYARGVEEFLTFAQADPSETDVPVTDIPKTDVPETDVPETDVPKTYSCPCCHCVNRTPQPPNIIRDHLFVYGMLPSYTTWIWHGKSTDNPSVPKSEKINEAMDDRMEDMIRDVGPDAFKRAHEYDSLCKDKDEPLYLGCNKKYTRLSTSLKLINLKVIHGWTDKGFTELLELLADMLPVGNTLPKRTYEAKKILCLMGVEYKKIHACPNDCILYRKDFENFHKCPTCNWSRYKVNSGESSFNDNSTKGPPAKVLWYLPIIPRFKRLFATMFLNIQRSQTCGGCHNVAVQVSNPMTIVASKGSCSPSNPKVEEVEELEEKIDWLRKIHVFSYDDGDKHAKLKLEHENIVCFISPQGLNDMAFGKGWLELSHLSLWCTYLFRQAVEKVDDTYGFLCPHRMNLKAAKNLTAQTVSVSEYIKQKLATNKKEIYLAPFCHSDHWQLVFLIPNANMVVWMCSYNRQPKNLVKQIFINGLKGNSTSDVTWLYPIMPIQTNGYHCGYYVMKFMLTIFTAGIVDNWDKVFINSNLFIWYFL